MKKKIVALTLGIFLIGSLWAGLAKADTSVGFVTGNFFKRINTNINFLVDNWSLGSEVKRIYKGWFSEIDTNIINAENAVITHLNITADIAPGPLRVATSTPPEIRFIGDADTGIAWLGYDQLGIMSGGSTKLTINSSGISVNGNVAGGTWTGNAIGDAYLTKTGDWTGKFDGQEGSYYLNAANLTNFGTPFYGFLHGTSSDALSEGATNKYYTDDRARAAISASSPLGYNSGTGALSIQVANGSQNGYLSSSDWTTFNNKQPAGSYLTSLAGNSLTKGYLLVGNDAGQSQATSSIFVSSTGRVGIGTTSPSQKLSVQGNILADAYLEYSPKYEGDALAAIRNIKAVKNTKQGDWAEIDHDTLPAGVKYTDANGFVGRDLGRSVQLNLKAIQQLDQEVNLLKAQVVGAANIGGAPLGAVDDNGLFIVAKKVTTDELCIGETCIKEQELKDLLKMKDANFWEKLIDLFK